jgi:serine/threonine-protein kinase
MKLPALPGSDELRRRAIWTALIGIVVIGLAAVAALSAYYTVRHSISGHAIQVPDLTQLTVDEATALLKKSDLVLEEVAQRNDERIEAGRILAQDPPPGADIKLQRKVKVVVSLGDKITSVPELRGGAARRAQITLQQQGMRLGNQVYVYSKREEENLVIAQDPLPESAGLRQGTIALLVSRGTPPRTYVMPDLTGHTLREVTTFLSRAGLKPGPVRRDPGRAERPGTVVGQNPPAGYPARSGDVVTLTLAGSDDSG